MADTGMDHEVSEVSEGEIQSDSDTPNSDFLDSTPPLSKMIMRAQDTQFSIPESVDDNSGFQKVNKQRRKRRRDSDSGSATYSESTTHSQSRHTVTSNDEVYYEARERQRGPKVVIIKCAEVNLSRVNPIKVAKALKQVASDSIQKVSKVVNGLAVQCFSASQAFKLKQITTLGDWAVTVEYPKSEIQSRGVISGMPVEVTEQEILDNCKSGMVQSVKRLNRKVDGKWE